jgi:crotonobetainyl-CoA:carnitine CoA-transferase CaiB-like acyl-CoA transferase
MVLEFPNGQTHLGMPIKFGGEPGEVRPTAPRLGEHSAQVLREAGLSEAEIEAALIVS